MKAVYSIVFVTCLIVLLYGRSVAQEYYQASVRSKSLAGISASLSDGWSVFGNQAGLANIDNPVVGISFSNYFLLDELALKSAFASIPVERNIFAVSFYRFGFEAYSENKIGIAFSKKIMPDFSAGFQFNYFFICLPENEKSLGDYCFEGGIQYQFSEKLLLGMHCFNPFQSGIKTESVKYKLPCLFRFGIAVQVAERLWLYNEFEKDLKHDFQSKFGLEYRILDNFQVRGGLAGKDNTLTFGFSYLLNQFTTDFSWQYNYRLGSTPSVAISYNIK